MSADVSLHAQLRYLERVDATEPHPATAVRRVLGRARPIDDHALELRIDERTGSLLVVRPDRDGRETVVTILPARGERR